MNDQLLNAIEREANRLHRIENLPWEAAKEQAITNAIWDEIERKQITPVQDAILKALETLSPRPQHPGVFKRQVMAALPYLSDDWQAWYHLDKLRDAGLVDLDGKRWKAVSTCLQLVDQHEGVA